MSIIDSKIFYLLLANKKYYPQTLLDECKYEIKKSKIENLINDDLDPNSSYKSDNEFDNESDDGSDDETDDLFVNDKSSDKSNDIFEN